MSSQTVASERDEEELALVGVVALVEIEGDWNVGFYGGGVGGLDGWRDGVFCCGGEFAVLIGSDG